ncbi:fungal specific transcription factor domain-containing [Fusarium albosuccineum]|uniref:Fungal specific transcription factor domain-containing n=1 Tax=Fusarium albosuccineum TaxID=1237068 RepID=A0A8H4LK15_9HYPO|nr:fungal specific transcription factor domain-containing [Fusarium albosuccineum]
MRNIRLDKLPANRQTATQGKLKAAIRLSSYADYLGCQAHISAEGTAILSHDSGSVITNRVADLQVLFQRAGRISDLVTNIQLFGRYSSHALGDILLNHFNTEVACQLAWSDGPGNPWRNLVLPLAQRSTCLHLSILGLAAAHMSIKSTDGNAAIILQACYRFRDASLPDLNMKLNSELGRNSETATADFDTSSLIDMITTMVSLCYGELLIPDSVNWRLHLRACRASLDRYSRQTHRHQELISQFLIEEVTYLETFGTICFFAGTPSRRSPTQSWSISDDCFWRFTELVNATTAVERDRFRTLEDGHQLPDIDMGIWKSKLAEAFDSACASMNSGFIQDAATQTCLGSLLHHKKKRKNPSPY